MELIIVFILGLMLFVIPELLRLKKQNYEYPDIPEPEQEMDRSPLYHKEESVSADDSGEGVSLEWKGQTAKYKAVMPVAYDVAPQTEERNPWTGQLSLPHVVNGVIFAEILQPPRAKRPVPCWWKH